MWRDDDILTPPHAETAAQELPRQDRQPLGACLLFFERPKLSRFAELHRPNTRTLPGSGSNTPSLPELHAHILLTDCDAQCAPRAWAAPRDRLWLRLRPAPTQFSRRWQSERGQVAFIRTALLWARPRTPIRPLRAPETAQDQRARERRARDPAVAAAGSALARTPHSPGLDPAPPCRPSFTRTRRAPVLVPVVPAGRGGKGRGGGAWEFGALQSNPAAGAPAASICYCLWHMFWQDSDRSGPAGEKAGWPAKAVARPSCGARRRCSGGSS